MDTQSRARAVWGCRDPKTLPLLKDSYIRRVYSGGPLLYNICIIRDKKVGPYERAK